MKLQPQVLRHSGVRAGLSRRVATTARATVLTVALTTAVGVGRYVLRGLEHDLSVLLDELRGAF